MYFVKSTLFFIKNSAQNFVGSKKKSYLCAIFCVIVIKDVFFVTFYVGLKMGFGTKFVERF